MRSLPAVTLALLVTAGTGFSQEWQFRTLTGSTAGGGYRDGAALSARFSTPTALAVCADAIFIADSGNHAIRRLSRDGQVTTWAGALTVPGSVDGDRLQARFRYPFGIVADSQCNLTIAERGNHTIRRITAAGNVTTIAGLAGSPGSASGIGAAARFRAPQDLALDSTGAVWITDTGNHTVRRMTSDGRVTTVAGTAGAFGFSSTLLYQPEGITVDAAGNAYVCEIRNNAIRKVTPQGVMTTLHRSTTFFPSDAVIGPDGALYVASDILQVVQRIGTDGIPTIVAGKESSTAWRDGRGAAARFDAPFGIALDVDGTFLIAEDRSTLIRRVTTDGEVTTIAGTVPDVRYAEGTAAGSRFDDIGRPAIDANGVAYVGTGSTIRRIARDGTTTTIAGLRGDTNYRDGSRDEARFGAARVLALEPSGSLVVADSDAIRRVTLDGSVTTIAGSRGKFGYVDAEGAEARFNSPTAMVVAADGTIYICETGNHDVRKIVGTTVSTLARDAAFQVPMGLDLGPDGNVYMWDENASALFRITPAGVVTVVAESRDLLFNYGGLAMGPDGSAYIGGGRVHSILRLPPGGTAFEWFAGDDFSIGNENGDRSAVRFRSPGHLKFSPDGRLFVVDANLALRVTGAADPPPPPGPRRRAVGR
jgi:streptogramin lyase